MVLPVYLSLLTLHTFFIFDACSLECYTCDSRANDSCGVIPEEITVRNCTSNATRCLKAIYDTTPIEIIIEMLDEVDDLVREQTLRVIRKCYDREIFALPLTDDVCEKRVQGLLIHTFCLCTTDLCNSTHNLYHSYNGILIMMCLIKLFS